MKVTYQEAVEMLIKDSNLTASYEQLTMRVVHEEGLQLLVCTATNQTFNTMYMPVNVEWEVKYVI